MDIKEDWKKRAVSGLMVLAMVLSLLPTTIFAVDTRSATDNAIKNGSFEQPEFGDRKSPQWPADQVPDWHTTAFKQEIEFGSTRQDGTVPHISGKPNLQDGGYQFVELNAEEESTLYQDATTVGGNVYEWGLAHRGRTGIDRMALIIGPEQKIAPAKPNAAGRDQFMQMTDWVRNHAAEMQVTIPDTGCTQKITVYSKPFDKNGGFENNADNNPFSATPSDVYSEEWNVWIIGTSNTDWGNYGTNSEEYEDGTLSYSCRYTVPSKQSKTIFAFCSYSSAAEGTKYGKTVGNLIDNIHFSLYQAITIGANGGGSGSLTVSADDKDEVYEVSGGNGAEALAPNGGTVTVRADETEDTQFLGAYVTRQTPSGMVQEFFSADKWTKQPDGSYTYEHKVVEPVDIVLVFVKKTVAPEIEYDANGGDAYTHGDGGGSTVSFNNTTTYTAQAATEKDGWQFTGWLLARSGDLLPANHTVTYDGSNGLTFTKSDGSTVTIDGGATLIAQWQWRQRFVVQVKSGGDFTNDTACGTVTVNGGATSDATADCYAGASERVSATAAASSGYHFLGWYDSEGQFLDNSATYSYSVDRGSVRTVYARFAPLHKVEYCWTDETDRCPPKELLDENGISLPAASMVMDGDTYFISQSFIAGQTRIPGTTVQNNKTVYGEWVFSGWRDESNEIRETELVDVTSNCTLTGYWTFMANTRYKLTYRAAESNSWTPSDLSEPAGGQEYFRTEPVTAAGVPTYTQGALYVDQNLTLKGTWTFGGWKRSDAEDTVAAGGKFNMPGNDMTLTGQWSFVPDTYTVSYNIGNGEGDAPAPHNSYDYSALAEKSGCDTTQSGIPFGASITLREFTGKAPRGTYFAGWSIVKPASDNLDTIQTQGPGAVVDDETLQITKDGNHDVTLYAVYKPVGTATVEFDATPADGGTVSRHSGSFAVEGNTIKSGEFVSVAKAKDGWHFVGWYEETATGTVVQEGAGAEKLTVTAEMMADKLGLLAEKEDSNETPVREVRYIAAFAPNMFTIQYDSNYPSDAGDKSGEMENQTFSAVNASRDLNANQFRCKGYTFAGWTTQSDGTGDFYSDGAAFTQTVENNGTVTLYAKWERLPDVTITYAAYPDSLGSVALNDDDTVSTQSKIVYEKLNPETGRPLGAAAMPNTGSVFAGWYDRANGQNAVPVSKDATFTPQEQSDGRYVSASYVAYFRPQRYTLTFDANGGVGEMTAQTFQHGQSHPLDECLFSRDGYDFVGWALSKNGEKQFNDRTEVQFTDLVSSETELQDGAAVTLYAIWQERDVTLNYASSDETLGTVSNASESVKAATGVPAGSTAQAKSGVQFDGWYSADGTLLSTELTFVPTKADGVIWQGTTYYARFSAQRRPSAPSTPEKPDDTKTTLAPIPAMLNGEDHYAYLLGYEDGTVRPNGSITRAEVATVLFRLLKDDVRTQNLTKNNAYSDVSDTAWYSAAVSTLSKMGVISGYPDGTFRPNAPITRAEFAAMIARFDETAEAVDTPFTDISGHWAENEISKAYGSGWVEGSSKTAFCPESSITRAETATLLNRVLHRLPETESDLLADQIVWPDDPKTFWGYLAVQEATNSHEYERKADGVHETQTAKRENRDWSKEFEQ